MNYDINERQEEKMVSDKRSFSLKPMEGKKVLSSTGAVDSRLFTGETKLTAHYNIDRGLWAIKYDGGSVPGGLQGEFTDFQKLTEHVITYYKSRNIDAEVIYG